MEGGFRMHAIQNPTSINAHLQEHTYTEATFYKCTYTNDDFHIFTLL
jgi:hypothetical protein